MTDEQFILILKSKLKEYYIENRSVGMELKELVTKFRQEIEQNSSKYKQKTKSETQKKL